MNIKKITEANRAAWNEAIPVQRRSRTTDYRSAFEDTHFSVLDEVENAKLSGLSLAGRKVAQLCCNNGVELLSLLTIGAEAGVGFDISDVAIEEANELARISRRDCRFVRTDVYDLGTEYRETFDLIYLTAGTLGWLPDLNQLFATIAAMLTDGGHLAIYEMHPFTGILADKTDPGYDPDNPYAVVFPYFQQEAFPDDSGIDYVGKTTYEARTSYWFNHSMAEILTGLIRQGIVVEELCEYPHDVSGLLKDLEQDGKVPLSYFLTGRRQ